MVAGAFAAAGGGDEAAADAAGSGEAAAGGAGLGLACLLAMGGRAEV